MKKAAHFLALQVNGLFPSLYPVWKNTATPNLVLAPVRFLLDVRRYRKLYRQSCSGDRPFPLRIINDYPNLYDRYDTAGHIPRHYFYQDLWAARKIHQSGVEVHYDIGSRLDGFVAHCLCFTRVVMLDIRPLPFDVEDLAFLKCDCTDMRQIKSGSVRSISSLHAIEHIGLGRYGDNIDPDGYVKVINEMKRVLAPQGMLYVSVPIGRQRLEFNAHRIFDPHYILHLFRGLKLQEFSAINDKNEIVQSACLNDFTCAHYSCGLFHFTRE